MWSEFGEWKKVEGGLGIWMDIWVLGLSVFLVGVGVVL